MDDPLFDPWGADAPDTDPRGPRPTRWRSPGGPPPSVPPASDRREVAESGRLAGTRGYLRSMATPRLGDLVSRVRMSQHEAWLEDLLEGSPSLLRVTFRARRGPFVDGPPAPFATLEIELQEAREELVVARWWIEPTVRPTAEVSMPPSRVNAGWLEQVFLDFVEAVLYRAG